MLRLLIKNSLKLIMRDKMTLYMGILFPVFIIMMTAICLSTSLEDEIKLGKIKLGYSNPTQDYKVTEILEELKQYNIEPIEIEETEGLDYVRQGLIAGYMVWIPDKCDLYLPEVMTDQSVYIKNQLTLYMQYSEAKFYIEQGKSLIQYEKVEAPRPVESSEYYGIVGLSSCLWIGAYCAGKLASLDRRGGLATRMRHLQIPSYIIFLARFIPALVVQLLMCLFVMGLDTFVLKINWGSSMLLLFSFIFIEMLAFVCFCICLSFWLKREQSIIVVTGTLWIVAGFLGGNFQNYIHNFMDERWQRLSPFYYINRALIEILKGGESLYLRPSITFLLCIMITSIGLSFLGIQMGRRKDV